MERVSRLLVFVGLFGLFYFVFLRKGGGSTDLQPLRPEVVAPATVAPGAVQRCDLWTQEYRATLSSRGGVVEHLIPLSGKYKKHGV
ncbi:MAG TPA: hypothetical protein VLC09_15830, partial [Polyangiaceae bacterium]|nr:hypothetical protein [Polyangiaceae bacterium]